MWYRLRGCQWRVVKLMQYGRGQYQKRLHTCNNFWGCATIIEDSSCDFQRSLAPWLYLHVKIKSLNGVKNSNMLLIHSKVCCAVRLCSKYLTHACPHLLCVTRAISVLVECWNNRRKLQGSGILLNTIVRGCHLRSAITARPTASTSRYANA